MFFAINVLILCHAFTLNCKINSYSLVLKLTFEYINEEDFLSSWEVSYLTNNCQGCTSWKNTFNSFDSKHLTKTIIIESVWANSISMLNCRCRIANVRIYGDQTRPSDLGDNPKFHAQGTVLTPQTLHFQLSIPNPWHHGLQQHVHGQCHHPVIKSKKIEHRT